jgi:rare lipoprotein A (peptidoglycan hydrolase)
MQTVLNRAGGAIPRLFVFLAAAGVMLAAPAYADFGGNLPGRTVTASWYGAEFGGRMTASGTRFDPRGMTAAHRTLPFGTKIRVTNPRTGASVLVTVTDRGPYRGRRELDLSKAAAREVGILMRGVAPVVVEVL